MHALTCLINSVMTFKRNFERPRKHKTPEEGKAAVSIKNHKYFMKWAFYCQLFLTLILLYKTSRGGLR